MTNRPGTNSVAHPARSALAVALARVVVPLWLLAGAVLKLLDASPSNLPVALIKWAGALDLDLGFVFRFNIAAELIVVGVMWLLPRLARPIGMLMLASFLPVLAADVAMGASSCGCFGAVEVHPGVTMAVDLCLFLGLWLLGRGVESLAMTPLQPTWRVLATGLWAVCCVLLAFGASAPVGGSRLVDTDVVKSSLAPAEGYYLPSYEEWLGSPWNEVPIAAWIQGAPPDLDQGVKLILFYRKDCEHCHELMEAFFAGPLTVPTTAVAVPERAGFPTVGALSFPCDECVEAELPSGVDWFLQTPVLVRLNGGVVECAAEVTVDDPQCLAS